MALDVPVFMTIAFLFPVRSLGARLLRVMVPLWVWSAVTGVVCFAFGERYGVADWIGQLTLGHVFCKPLYFLSLLAVFTLLLHPLRKRANRVVLPVLAGVSVFCWLWQFAGLNFRFFGEGDPVHAVWCGRFFELLPCACLGLAVARLRIAGWKVAVGALALAVFARLAGLRLAVGCQFGYGGMVLPLLGVAVVLVCRSLGERPGVARLAAARPLFDLSSVIYYSHTAVGFLLAQVLHGEAGGLRASIVFFLSGLVAMGLRQWRLRKTSRTVVSGI